MNPDQDENLLKNNLKNIGFDQTTFEPKVNNRFIVTLGNIPSYVIKNVSLPTYNSITRSWNEFLKLKLYNPIGLKLEERLIDLINQEKLEVKIKLLTSRGEVDTTWTIEVSRGTLQFNNMDWANEGEPTIIDLSFNVEKVNISY